MNNETMFLIKIKNSKEVDIEDLKKYLYYNTSLIHLNQMDDCTLDVTVKELDLNDISSYSRNNDCDLTVIYYNNTGQCIEKIYIQSGVIRHKDSMFLDIDLNDNTFKYKLFNKLKFFLDK